VSVRGIAASVSVAWLVFTAPTAAQMFGDRQRVECGNLAEGDIVESSIEIVCGMTAAEFADNMRLALSPLEADKHELFRRLHDLLPESSALRAGAIRSFFRTLGEREVAPEQLQGRLPRSRPGTWPCWRRSGDSGYRIRRFRRCVAKLPPLSTPIRPTKILRARSWSPREILSARSGRLLPSCWPTSSGKRHSSSASRPG
jgi:hypothetical protein